MRPLLAVALICVVAAFDDAAALPTAAPAEAGYTIDTSLEDIVANPAGAAVIRKDIPGLLENSSYPMFKSMSLRLMGSLSGGRLTGQMLAQTGADLAAVPVPPDAHLSTVSQKVADPEF